MINPNNDADLETLQMNQLAAQVSRLRKKGICTHNAYGPVTLGRPERKCSECGKIFPTAEDLHEERRELLI